MAGKSGPTGLRTKTSKSSAPELPQKQQFPYKKYEGGELWRSIDAALDDLVRNGDLQEKTARRYIVGYLCQALALTPKAS
jgi:hypothetical protein